MSDSSPSSSFSLFAVRLYDNEHECFIGEPIYFQALPGLIAYIATAPLTPAFSSGDYIFQVYRVNCSIDNDFEYPVKPCPDYVKNGRSCTHGADCTAEVKHKCKCICFKECEFSEACK